jgi:hypothetical protein
MSLGRTRILVAFHLNGIILIYRAATKTLSFTLGAGPLIQLYKKNNQETIGPKLLEA